MWMMHTACIQGNFITHVLDWLTDYLAHRRVSLCNIRLFFSHTASVRIWIIDFKKWLTLEWLSPRVGTNFRVNKSVIWQVVTLRASATLLLLLIRVPRAMLLLLSFCRFGQTRLEGVNVFNTFKLAISFIKALFFGSRTSTDNEKRKQTD